MTLILETLATRDFTCLGDACEDTCCKGWGMQLTQETVDLYKASAPELMEAVTSGEAEFIMKRNIDTDYCVKFDAGWCGIHKQYGDRFLGDACHFYPRVTRGLAEETLMTLAPSCPEAARLMLALEAPFDRSVRVDARVPYSLKQYSDGTMQASHMLALHDAFMGYVDTAPDAQTAMAGIYHVATRLAMQPVEAWPDAAPFYMRQPDDTLAEPQPADSVRVVNALQGLIKAGKATKRPRLIAVTESMASAIAVVLDWETAQATPSDATLERMQDMQAAWQGYYRAELDAALKRYIQMQLSLSFFPFAGIGERIDDKALIIAVRFATVQQALMSYCMIEETLPALEDQVRVIQPISRFMDHLSDPALSLAIYREVGWHRQPRLNALLGKAA